MIVTEKHDKRLRELEHHSFYSVAKYLYLIRTEEDNKHARLISLMEMIPRYLSYILIAECKQAKSLDTEYKKSILNKVAPYFQTPSFGDWKEMLRILLSDLSANKDARELPHTKLIIAELWTERRGLDSLLNGKRELFQIIQEIKPKYIVRKPNSTTVRLFDLIDMLVTYRNAFYGHGDIANSYEYQQHNQVILNILIDLLDEITVFHSKKLAYLERVKYQNKQFQHELFISTGRHIDFDRHVFIEEQVFEPEHVYLCDEVVDSSTGETKYIPTLSLHPLIVYTFDRKENNRNLLFLGDLKDNHVGYTGYPSNYFYEPTDPASIFQAFFDTETDHQLSEKNYADGDYVKERTSSLLGRDSSRVYEIVNPAENPQIWENFEDIYYAYNAPFQLERETDLDGLVDKHKLRYENPKLKKTKYLFFLGKADDEEDVRTFTRRLNNFLTFMRKLYQKIPTILEMKLEIYIVRSEFPNITFFTGKKMGNPYGIIYFHNPNFMNEDMPKMAFLTKDEELITSLTNNFENDLKRRMVIRYYISDLLNQESPIEKIIKDLSYSVNVRKRFNDFTNEMALVDSIAKQKQKAGHKLLHLEVEKSPFYFQYLLKDLLLRQINDHDEPQHKQNLSEKAKQFYEELLLKPNREKEVIVSEDLDGVLFNILLTIEGDLLLPIPAPQSYVKMVKKLDDQVIHVPLYFNGVKITSPAEFEKLIFKAKADGKNPKKLLLNEATHSFWFDWSREELKEFTNICKDHGILVIVDGFLEKKKEAYSYLLSQLESNSVLITELSAYLTLDGYKIGAVFFPKELDLLYDTVSLLSNSTSRAIPRSLENLATQYYEQHHELHLVLKKCTDIYNLVRSYVESELRQMPNIDYYISSNGYEVYLDFENYRDALALKGIKTSLELTIDILEKVNLVVIPGILFGEHANKLRLGLRFFNIDGNRVIESIDNLEEMTTDEFADRYCPNITMALQQLQFYLENSLNSKE